MYIYSINKYVYYIYIHNCTWNQLDMTFWNVFGVSEIGEFTFQPCSWEYDDRHTTRFSQLNQSMFLLWWTCGNWQLTGDPEGGREVSTWKMDIYIYIYTYIHTYIYIYINTYTMYNQIAAHKKKINYAQYEVKTLCLHLEQLSSRSRRTQLAIILGVTNRPQWYAKMLYSCIFNASKCHVKPFLKKNIYIAMDICPWSSQVDPDDQTAKIKVQAVGDVWCADSAVIYDGCWSLKSGI